MGSFTSRKIVNIPVALVFVVAGFAYFVTFANPGWRLSRAYPGSVICLNHPNSPDPSPYDLIRILSPFPYIGSGEYASVSLTSLPYPLRFDRTKGERILYLYVENCKVEDISALLENPESLYAAFHGCDLLSLPKEQREKLRETWDDVENCYIYYIGNV